MSAEWRIDCFGVLDVVNESLLSVIGRGGRCCVNFFLR